MGWHVDGRWVVAHSGRMGEDDESWGADMPSVDVGWRSGWREGVWVRMSEWLEVAPEIEAHAR